MLNAQSNTPLNIMPLPAKVERGDGSLKIDASFRIAFAGYREPRLEHAGLRLERQIQRQPGWSFFTRTKARDQQRSKSPRIAKARPFRNLARMNPTSSM